VFAFFPEVGPTILVNLLHGICYAFFFATVYIFVDEFFPKDARASAQGLFNFLILGFGPFVGNNVWPHLEAAFTRHIETDGQTLTEINYRPLFLVPSATALAAAVLLLLFFHPPARADIPKEEEVPQTIP
jgi:MFS family permease